MISSLELFGFKCFENEKFNLSNLTVLSGLNSSGKSSVLQAIRILYHKKFIEGHGTNKEIVSDLCHECKLIINANDATTCQQISFNKKNLNKFLSKGRSKFCDIFSYISASRLGPELMLPIDYKSDTNSVGEKGENVLNFIEKYHEIIIPEQIKRSESSNGLIANINAWLSIISPNVEFDYQSISQIDHRISTYNRRRATNVGFGLSYSLPIIANLIVYATLLHNKKVTSPIILLENPEAHLHPRGQLEIGKLIAIVANMGVQVIVETHSDHLLNGIRIAIKEKIITPPKTTFLFFKNNNKGENCKSSVEQPKIDEHGFFDEWPEGFFDETEKALMRLL